jgi:hypothetical protein
MNTHMVWHLIVKDDRLFWSCNLPISSLRPGYRTLTTLVIFTDKIGRPARVLGPSPFGLDQLGATSGLAKTGEGTGFTSRLADQYRCMHMVWESIWWCLMWLCMVVSDSLPKKIKDKTARKHDRHPCMQSTLRRNMPKHVEVPLEHRTVRVGRVGRVAPTHELRAAGAGETYSRPRSASTSAIPGIRRPETSTLNAHCCHC